MGVGVGWGGGGHTLPGHGLGFMGTGRADGGRADGGRRHWDKTAWVRLPRDRAALDGGTSRDQDRLARGEGGEGAC